MIALQGLTSPYASFSIISNAVLRNINALSNIAQCSNGPPYNTVNVPVAVQVLLSTGRSCTLASWAGVCRYINAYTGNPSVSACPTS